MNYLQNNYNICRHLLKTSLHHRVQHTKVTVALPILDDKAVANFYDNFVNC